MTNHTYAPIVEANPQQENNFVFLSPFHSIFVIVLPACLVSASQCRRVARKKPCALYCVCVEKYADLLNTSCERYQRVLSDRAVQQSRIQEYNVRIDQFIASAAAFYNSQVLEEVKSIKECTPPRNP